MPPIYVPPLKDPAWARARVIAATLRAEGASNPFIVGALVNALAESAWKPVVAGDHDQSFGPWQLKFAFYGQPILDALGIDIRTESDLAKQTHAVLFALAMAPNAKTLAALRAARTGAEATRIWAAGFERASAGGAVERRVSAAAAIEVALAHLG